MDTKNLESEEEFNTNGAPKEPESVEDIDPRKWLTADDSAIVGRVKTRAGYLKVAALTEAETDHIRKGSEKWINPGKQSLGKRVDLKTLRLLTACESINKAHLGVPGYIPIMPTELDKKLAGEITSIVNQITKLSGYTEEE